MHFFSSHLSSVMSPELSRTPRSRSKLLIQFLTNEQSLLSFRDPHSVTPKSLSLGTSSRNSIYSNSHSHSRLSSSQNHSRVLSTPTVTQDFHQKTVPDSCRHEIIIDSCFHEVIREFRLLEAIHDLSSHPICSSLAPVSPPLQDFLSRSSIVCSTFSPSLPSLIIQDAIQPGVQTSNYF